MDPTFRCAWQRSRPALEPLEMQLWIWRAIVDSLTCFHSLRKEDRRRRRWSIICHVFCYGTLFTSLYISVHAIVRQWPTIQILKRTNQKAWSRWIHIASHRGPKEDTVFGGFAAGNRVEAIQLRLNPPSPKLPNSGPQGLLHNCSP